MLEFSLALLCVIAVALLAVGVIWRANWLSYELFVPTAAGQKPLPALVMLHGRSGDTTVLRNWLGLDEFAERHGFMVIYPQSHQDGWDFGVGIRERGQLRRRYINHTRYVLDIVEQVNDSHLIDRSRLFVAGVSDGASMAIRMSCVESETFRGIISVAATIPFYAVEDCSQASPLSALLIHGVDDTVMPWKGTTYKQFTVFLSFEESVAWWAARNQCPQMSADQPDYQSLVGEVGVRHISGCRNDTHVTAYRINDGGHTWPGRDHPQKRTRGHVNRDIDASRVVADWIIGFQSIAPSAIDAAWLYLTRRPCQCMSHVRRAVVQVTTALSSYTANL